MGMRVLSENRDPATDLRTAREGDLFVWSHVEPDRTYHSHADTLTLIEKVRGAVRTIAERIITAAAAVPAHLRLRIILTTDHGRFLGKNRREIAIPQGMESHQRVALGSTQGWAINEGYVLRNEDETVILDGRRFGFSDTLDCAISLSGQSFLANDGKKGLEHFPHGGIAPEEVMIPWLELVRDQEPPHIECRAVGEAREGRAGRVTVYCVNTGKVDVMIDLFEFQFRDKPKTKIVVNVPLPRMSEKAVICSIDIWPTPSDLKAASAIAQIKLPVGDIEEVGVELDLISEGFYSRENILDDLK
jgi:hypothetical protein